MTITLELEKFSLRHCALEDISLSIGGLRDKISLKVVGSATQIFLSHVPLGALCREPQGTLAISPHYLFSVLGFNLVAI